MNQEKILITGANGQLGRVLAEALRNKYGKEHVLATDIRKPNFDNAPFEFLDILNKKRIVEIIEEHNITQIYHLAAILSASGEADPKKTWNVNLNALLTIMTIAEEMKISRFFYPSTIAVFGKTTPRVNTPQDCPLLPETVYGMSKATGEFWCNYFNMRYKFDVRSVRYPGIIGHQSLPEGGTTDYAVEIFHAAIKGETYKCFLAPDTRLPMMFIEDAIRATIELMEGPSDEITIRTSYNLAAMSFSPKEIYDAIKLHYPDFKIEYKPDFRQQIAESWTESIDDSMARKDWNWNHKYDLEAMVSEMIKHLKVKLLA
ncbi:NAD-dependent epimerase/dehydratase family protein [Saprospiraceae bacterium]|nr:NAD-dependent epimerase/dehydratase family protein [Saprospiraceae bacterium]